MGWFWSWEMLELAKHTQAVGSTAPVLGSIFQVSVGASRNKRCLGGWLRVMSDLGMQGDG